MTRKRSMLVVAVSICILGSAIGISVMPNIPNELQVYNKMNLGESTGFPTGASNHDPISIFGNLALIEFIVSEGFTGNGTATNPYIIEDLVISVTDDFVNGIDIYNSDKYLIIRNCTVIGNTLTYSNGISISDAQNVRVFSNSLFSLYTGIELYSCSDCQVEMNEIQDAQGGMQLWSSDHIDIFNNYLSEIELMGIMLVRSRDSRIDSNVIVQCGGNGIYLEDSCDFNVIQQNYIESMGGIIISFSNANTIDANVMKNSEYSSLNLLFASDNNITNNELQRTGISLGEGCFGNIIDETNTVGGHPILYYDNAQNIILSADFTVGQVIFLYCQNILVENMEFENSSNCILMIQSTNATIVNNRFTLCTDAIDIQSCSLISIENNFLDCYGHSAISLAFSVDVILTQNHMFGTSLFYYSNQGVMIDLTNTFDGKLVVYYNNESGLSIDGISNIGQIILVECDNFKIENMNLLNATIGILLEDCTNGEINYNYIENCQSAIRILNSQDILIFNNEIYISIMALQVLDSSYCIVSNNEIKRSEFQGIGVSSGVENQFYGNSISEIEFIALYIFNSNNNTIRNNVITNNSETGIEIWGESAGNLIYLNDIFGNGDTPARETSFSSGNYWDNGSVGNYWGDEYILQNPTATNDGYVWDKPFLIEIYDGIADNYPLVNLANPIIPEEPIDTSSPVILSAPDDFSLRGWYSNITLTWTVEDENPAQYAIFINGCFWICNTNWTNDSPIQFSLPWFIFRMDYNITLIVWDENGNVAQDTVIFTMKTGIPWFFDDFFPSQGTETEYPPFHSNVEFVSQSKRFNQN